MARALTACLIAAIVFAAAGPVAAVPGGAIDVLPQGAYVCEVPGEAADPFTFAGRHVPESDFEVIGDSSYRTPEGRGVYLLTGERVAMTSGPLRGSSFQRVSSGFLRVSGGGEGAMRCVRSTQAVALDPALGGACPKGAAALAKKSPGGSGPPQRIC